VYTVRPCDPDQLACDEHPGRRKHLLGGAVSQWGEKVDSFNFAADVWPGASALAERLVRDDTVAFSCFFLWRSACLHMHAITHDRVDPLPCALTLRALAHIRVARSHKMCLYLCSGRTRHCVQLRMARIYRPRMLCSAITHSLATGQCGGSRPSPAPSEAAKPLLKWTRALSICVLLIGAPLRSRQLGGSWQLSSRFCRTMR
jgi:hypothetical protein